MMKKVRGLGKGFFILSALLLMFVAVGCDDSDSTTPTSNITVDEVTSGAEVFQGNFTQNAVTNQTYSTNNVGATREGDFNIDTVAQISVPPNTTVYSDFERKNPLTGNIDLVIKAFDQTSIGDLPDNDETGADDTEWQTAGFMEAYFVDGDDDERVDDDFYLSDYVTLTMTFANDAILPGGGTVAMYQREDGGNWTLLTDADPETAGTQPFTVDANRQVSFKVNHLSHFSAQIERVKSGIDVDDYSIDGNCDATIVMGKNGNNSITSLQYRVYNASNEAFVMSGSSSTASFNLNDLVGEFEYMVDVYVNWTAGVSAHETKVRLRVSVDCDTGSGGVTG